MWRAHFSRTVESFLPVWALPDSWPACRCARALTERSCSPFRGPYKVNETITPMAKAQSYNNFYEFGTDKSDPAKNAHSLRTRPWTVKVEGLCKKPQTVDIDTILRYRPIEERVYRFRCVEAWSMVIPWAGYPLAEFIKAMEPLPGAKFVQFLSLADQSQEPGLSESSIRWPYSEGLPALMEALAKALVAKRAPLTAAKLRFLRKNLAISSRDFAAIIGLGRRAIFAHREQGRANHADARPHGSFCLCRCGEATARSRQRSSPRPLASGDDARAEDHRDAGCRAAVDRENESRLASEELTALNRDVGHPAGALPRHGERRCSKVAIESRS